MIKATGIQRSFGELRVLRGVDITVEEGESVVIRGASGAGKSTLLQILGTLDRPDHGSLLLMGQECHSLADRELARLRNRNLGFVFQFHHLLREFTALENVAMPARIAGVNKKKANRQGLLWLERLGLKARAGHFPDELSGGERQRVAIARALIQKPKILFADEPTGNLDSANSEQIEALFFELQKELKLTLVVVTHSEDFSRRFERVLRLQDGLWL